MGKSQVILFIQGKKKIISWKSKDEGGWSHVLLVAGGDKCGKKNSILKPAREAVTIILFN